MELSTKQIQHIDKRLQKNGITYWDIRIEILDHLVSEIESKLAKGESYESALENAFFKLKLNGNLEELNKSRLLRINKIVRNQFFRKIKDMLSSFKNLFFIAMLIVFYFIFFEFSSIKIFTWISFSIIFLPAGFGIVLHFLEYIKEQKSGYLIYSSFYIFFGILLLNIFLQFYHPDGIFTVTKETQKIIWFVVTCLNSIFCYAGISIYFNTKTKISNIEENLKLS